MTWYFSDLARFRSEREGIDVLSQDSDWFANCNWRIGDGVHLLLDADIVAGGRVYPIYLQYPEMFPYSPPSVFPRGDGGRWSHHQFGPGGELCLEYGPDNWTPDMTGVQMVESAHRLLEGENSVVGQSRMIASRHFDTSGQRLRSEFSRLVITRSLEAFLPSLPIGAAATCNFVSAHHQESAVHVIGSITLGDGTAWVDPTVPSQFAAEYLARLSPILRIPSGDALPSKSSCEAFRSDCAGYGLATDHRYVVVVRGADVHAYFLWEPDDSVAKVAIIPAATEERRLDPAHEALKSKSMALIGCGSLGSKIATMLGRAGLGRFVLVDDDILLPDNLVRHDLDWRDVGTHKAAAIQRRLQLVSPTADVTRWRARLAGQESSASAEGILKTIGSCDLIFDATADPDVLNLLSAVNSAAGKSVMWAEVFGGGIGGLIARCRPDREPPPQYMRRAIENWFAERGSRPAKAMRPYETAKEGIPLIADDADVSVIASHAARMAVDTLIDRDPSVFPNSVYAIGMTAGSVFSQPFDTYPIDVGPPSSLQRKQELPQEKMAAEIANVLQLFEARLDEAAPARRDSPEAPT